MAPNPQAHIKYDGAGTHLGKAGEYAAFGGVAPVALPVTVTGINAGNTGLQGLLTVLASIGLIVDGTTAS